MFKDYYSILGVPPSASGEMIRQAFKRLALLSHPDKTMSLQSMDYNQTMSGPSQQQQQMSSGGGNALQQMLMASTISEAASTIRPAFTDVQEAYEVLGDVARRYLYDLNYYELVQQQQQRMVHVRTQPARRTEAEPVAAPVTNTPAAAVAHSSHVSAKATHEINGMTREHKAKAPPPKPATLTREEVVVLSQPQAASQPSVSAEDTAMATRHKPALHKRRVSKSTNTTTTSSSEHDNKSSNSSYAAVSSSPGPSSAASTSPMCSTVLPAIRTVRRVNVTGWLNMKTSNTRRYPMPTAAAEGVTMEYYRTRAIDKTLRTFFAKELDALASGTVG